MWVCLPSHYRQGPIKYSNIDAGCYYVEMKPLPYPLPERTVPLCVVPLINITDMEAWDPYFSLETNPQRWAGVGNVGMSGFYS